MAYCLHTVIAYNNCRCTHMEPSPSYTESEPSSPFTPGQQPKLEATATGDLDGLCFAVKDLIDVAGWRTGCGNPDWLEHAEYASKSATVVNSLLAAGATLTGKTITDELAFSLEGNNAHYGIPLNPACPDRLPGGSSSGSASAVAQGLVDFSLGTDTGGSVRIPAAFCGVYGMRPSHGSVSLQGVMPFAPSYDCIGWFARDINILKRVAKAIMPGLNCTTEASLQLYQFTDAFHLVEPELADAMRTCMQPLGDIPSLEVFDKDQKLWLTTYQVLQGREIWIQLGESITQYGIHFGNSIAQRFKQCSVITDEEVICSQKFREYVCKHLDRLIPKNSAVILPGAPCLPLFKNDSDEQLDDFYSAALTLNSIAGHARLPQITLPAGTLNGCPVSLSLIGRRGDDFRLLNTAQSLVDHFNFS